MTNYHLKAAIPPSLVVHEKKAARKKLLEAIRARRAENYKRFKEKLQPVCVDGETREWLQGS
jgi:hypothetical protein